MLYKVRLQYSYSLLLWWSQTAINFSYVFVTCWHFLFLENLRCALQQLKGYSHISNKNIT